MHRNPGLDYVRAAAILMVMLCHGISHFWPAEQHRWALYTTFLLACIGVDLFFVLSGYLIGGILLKAFDGKPITGREIYSFWRRRWWRTIPNYLLFLCAYLALSGTVPRDLWRYFLFLQNAVWQYPIQGMYGISWSLTIEEWSYLLLPVFVAAGVAIMAWRGSVKRAHEMGSLLAILTLLIVPALLRVFTTSGHEWDQLVRKVMVYRLDAIATGVLLAWIKHYRPPLYDRLASVPAIGALGIAGASAALIVALSQFRTGFEGFATAIPTGFYINVLLLPLIAFSVAGTILGATRAKQLPLPLSLVLTRISLYSYSAYLLHLIVLQYMGTAIDDRIPHNAIGHLLFLTAYIVVTLVLSGIIYHTFEYPITRLRDRRKNQTEG